jgi:hypothetical protein
MNFSVTLLSNVVEPNRLQNLFSIKIFFEKKKYFMKLIFLFKLITTISHLARIHRCHVNCRTKNCVTTGTRSESNSDVFTFDLLAR